MAGNEPELSSWLQRLLPGFHPSVCPPSLRFLEGAMVPSCE